MIMKKITALILLCLAVLGLQAQTINRMIVQPKTGYPQGYAIDGVDSVFFDSVSDDVAAAITVNKVSTSSAGDTLWVAITPTADCAKFRITCVPTVRANALSSPATLHAYMDNVKSNYYYQTFTNAQMTGFDQPFEPASSYTLLSLAYDKYSTPCKVSKAEFTTPVAQLVGNPTVAWEITDATTSTLSMKFTPNADCKGYAICLFKAGEAQQQFEQWGAMFGFVNMGDMIKQFSGRVYDSEYTNTWTALAPGTDYEIYILPMDANGNYAPMVIASATTKQLGGTGEATVDISIGKYVSTEYGNYQEVTYTPNDQASLHRDIIITEEGYNEMGEDGVISYLKTDNPMNPYWDQYGVDVAQWNADPNTTYYACAIARNLNGEWGSLAKVKFTTPAIGTSAAKPAYISSRKVETGISFNGKAPAMNAKWAKRGLTLIEK